MKKILIAVIVAILAAVEIVIPIPIIDSVVSRFMPEAQAHSMIPTRHWELAPYDFRIDWCCKLAREDFKADWALSQRCARVPNVKLATGEALRPSTPHSSGDLVEQSTSVQS